MKFKSKLGFAALEELTETQAPEDTGTTDDAAAADAGAAAPGADAAAADTGAAAPAPDATPAADPAADAAQADAGAAAAAGDDAGAGAGAGDDAAAAAAGDDAAATDPAAAAADAQSAEDGAAASAADAATQAADATGEPTDAVGEDEVGDAEAEQVEGEMEAVDQIEDQAGDVQDDVEKLADATESLDGCVAILDAAAQRGGLDIYGASFLRNNLNTVTKSLKVKPLMIPALEDMETPSAKIDGAQGAKDQILAFIKRILTTIKQAFERLGQWIVETYKRLTNAFAAIEARATKLAERVKAAKMKEGKLESKSLATKLSINGRTVDDLPKFLTELAAFAKTLNDPKTYAPYLEAVDLAEEMLKTPEKADELKGKISEVLGKWASALEAVGHKSSFPAADLQLNANAGPNGKLVTFSLLDNQMLKTSIPTAADAIRGLSSTVESTKADSGATSVEALDQAAAGKICALVADLAKAAREASEGNRGGVKELTGEIKKRSDTIGAMANVALGQIMDEAEIKSAGLRKTLLFVNTLLMSAPKLPIHAVNRALPRDLGYALDYVAASLGGAAEAAPAAAAA